MAQQSPTPDTMRERSPHDHVVHIYTDDTHLVAELTSFIIQGLRQNENVVIVATGRHRAAVSNAIALDSQADGGALVVLDADETLQKFMAGGVPDSKLFESTIGGIVDSAASDGRPVRIFGEMVAVLWDQDNVTAALALEELWNDLAATRQFFLMCAYPSTSFEPEALQSVNSVCGLHSEVALLGDAEQMPGSLSTSQDPAVSKLFIPVPAAVPAARRFVIDTLGDWKLGHLAQDAALIVSELTANAVVHANTAFRMVMSRAPSGVVRLEVEDVASSRPQLRRAGPHDVSGRGMALIAALAHRWGCDVTPAGKTVWADIQP